MIYQGLVNEGATCYLNSLIQTLFMTYEFRKNVYAYMYLSFNAVMILKRFNKKIAYLINCKNYLSIYKLIPILAIQKASLKAFSGLRPKPSSNMMFSNFVEFYSMLLKLLIKIPYGSRGCLVF